MFIACYLQYNARLTLYEFMEDADIVHRDKNEQQSIAGRYGRLGHGDSDDQLRPKVVEALQEYKVIDVACGSGDAQTLCVTDDDNVWSWGDGDYGKLGRGGSDGCKVPLKIDSLGGLGVIKVECGSQFSVALTRSGAVYTW